MSGKAPRKSPAFWLNPAVPEFETVIRQCVSNCVDRQVNRLKAQDEEQHQQQAGKLKQALQLVLLNRNVTIKEAKEQHALLPSACTLFDRCLRPIKHKLMQLLGDKELRKDVLKYIETLRQNSLAVTFKGLWKKFGGPMRTAHTLGFTKSTAAARLSQAPAIPPPNTSLLVAPAASSALPNSAVSAAMEERIKQLEAELKREQDANATLKQRISVLEARAAPKLEEATTSASVLPPQHQPDLVAKLRDERNQLQDRCRQLQDQLDDLQTAPTELDAKLQDANAKLLEAEKMRDHYESTLAFLLGLGPKGAGHEEMPVAAEYKEELRQWNSGPARSLECLAPLGVGGHGAVFCERLSSLVAIKRIDVAANPGMVHYYFREAQLSHILRHPNMAPTLQRYFEDGKLCLVMPYYRAGSLDRITKKVRLPLEEAAHVACQLLQYLQFLHEDTRYLHRDIKHANVLVADDGTLKVADLGLCGPIDDRRTGIGTAEYLAPEAVRNRLEKLQQLLTTAVDIYSLGMLVYKLLMGRYPHRAVDKMPMTNDTAVCNAWEESLMMETCQPHFHDRVKAHLQSNKKLTDDCRTFILDCLKPDPKERPSASELLGCPFIARRQSAPWNRRVDKWLREKASEF